MVVVPCRFLPRDGRDAFISVVTLLLSAFATFLAFYLPVRIVLGPTPAAAVAFGLTFTAALVLALISVSRLRMDDEGITLERAAGGPRFVTWEQVTEIRPADRPEVVLRSWLWPGWPPNGTSRSLTSTGHYRIAWRSGACYFPPAELDPFLSMVERKWGGLL